MIDIEALRRGVGGVFQLRRSRSALCSPQRPAYSISLIGFLPLIAFNVLAGRVANNGIAWGALVALAIALINMAITRPRWPPKIINLISAGLFLVLTLIGFLGNRSIDGWLFDWASGLITLTLGLLLLVTMPIMPFTEQYARESVSREYWGTPTFKKVNRVLSLAWGFAIVGIGLSSMAVAFLDERAGSTSDTSLLDLILNWVVPIGILVFMVRLTGKYPDRVRKAAAASNEAPAESAGLPESAGPSSASART